jgi:hypothetical protein
MRAIIEVIVSTNAASFCSNMLKLVLVASAKFVTKASTCARRLDVSSTEEDRALTSDSRVSVAECK